MSDVKTQVGWAARLRTGWQQMRSRRWASWLVDGALLVLVFWGVTAWQTRHLLPTDAREPAPPFALTAFDGTQHRLSDAQGTPALLYFFAPWCSVCHASIDNVQALREARAEDDLAIYILALDWQNRDEIADFLANHDLDVPVLLAPPEVGRAYRITAFPTYYVLDEQGRVAERSVGYSTELGLRLRTL